MSCARDTGCSDAGGPPPSVNAGGCNARSDDVFNRIAGRSDVLCDRFSLGIVAIHAARKPVRR